MKMFAALPIIFLSVPAFAADDQVLTLFPQQRASHQETMDSQAASYEARGQTYVDAMYSSLGEGEDPYADEGAWENEEPLTAEQLENPFPDVAPVSAETAGEMKTDPEGADIVVQCPAIQGENVDQKFVDSFAKLARIMGVGCPVFYAQNGPSLTIEYLPSQENLGSWTKMMTANVMDFGNDKASDHTSALTAGFVEKIQKVGGNAKIISSTDPKDPAVAEGGVSYVIKYDIGAGLAKEDAVMIVRTVGTHLAALVQYQQRGDVLSQEQINLFKKSNGIISK